MRQRFQQRLASSLSLLPVCIVLSALMWGLTEGVEPLSLVAWCVCLLTAFVLLEADNQQQLLRVRSRLVPCVWLFVASCLPLLHGLFEVQLPSVCLAGSFLLLLPCYQRFQPVGHVFHCFLLLAVGSLFWVPMLVLAVPMMCCLWLLMLVRTWRTFWAALIGLALPYIFVCGWWWLAGQTPLIAAHFEPLAGLARPDVTAYRSLLSGELVPFLLILLLGAVGAVHHLSTSFADKIRVRLMLRVFVTFMLVTALLPALLPESLAQLTALLLVSATPLIAHFFALTQSRASNLFFILVLLTFAAMALLPLVRPLWG